MAGGQVDTRGVIVQCQTCGRSNRLAFATLTKPTRCGQCKATLSRPDSPVEIGDAAAFDAAATTSTLPLVIDFWAPWCGPCRTMAPELERLARTQAGKYLVVKVNSDEQPALASRFRIQSIPTLVVVSEGHELGRVSGARSARDIQAYVEQTLDEARR